LTRVIALFALATRASTGGCSAGQDNPDLLPSDLPGPPLAGTGLETEGLTHVLPRPEHVASADLTALGMPRMRAALASLGPAVVADAHAGA
jgi:hypothetical protein